MAYHDVNTPWEGWRVINKIGKGGFGAVYEIERSQYGIQERAAMKVITIPQSADEIDDLLIEGYDNNSITQRFDTFAEDIVREYGMMAQMKGNANIVYCDDYRIIQQDNGFGRDIYIRMELLTPLLKAMDQVSSESQIIRFGMEMCNALEACQKRKVIHRDIKPQNIFVSDDGVFKLGDFGIARKAEKTTRATVGKGTYQFMAPEVINDQPYGQTVDMYSLGLVMYWLLNNRRCPFFPLPPAVPTHKEEQEALRRRFSGEKIPEPKNGSKELKRIVLKACAFDPKDRYQSAREMREDLMHLSGITVLVENDRDFVYATQPEADDVDATVGPAFGHASQNGQLDATEKTVGPVFGTKVNEDSFEEEKTVGPVFTEQKKQKTEKKRRKIWPAIIAAACIVVAVLVVVFGMGKSATDNVLMEDVVEPQYDANWNLISQPAFGSDIKRDQIKTITFLDSLINAPDSAWDVSKAKDGSVKAWVESAGNLYNLFIAGNGGVTAPKNCRFLFAWYTNLEEIEFNNCFDTSDTIYMLSMFHDCESMQNLNLSDFDTCNVVTMSGMFSGCGALKCLDIGNFDTSNVKDMSAMFSLCENLEQLDISSFDTSNVTDMRNMFYLCDSLFVWNEDKSYFEISDIGISSFDTSNVQVWNDFIWSKVYERQVIGVYVDGQPWEMLFETSAGSDKQTQLFAGESDLDQKHIVKVVSGEVHNVALYSDGTVKSSGQDYHGEGNVEDWREIIDVCATECLTVGLKRDGSVVAAGRNTDGQCNVSEWTDISAIAASGYNIIGVKRDGTVNAVGNNDYGQCNVDWWTGIVQADIGTTHSVGLRADGTVVATGDNEYGQCNVSEWTDIVSVKVAYVRTIGLKADGTVVATGGNFDGECDVSNWTDIVAIDTDGNHTVGLRADGTVVAAGLDSWESFDACNVSEWTDIIYTEVGYYRTIGLKSDGTIVVTGWNDRGQCDIGELSLQ